MQEKKIVNYISKWLKDYALTSQTSGFVVGVSGGIDSALTSTLCAESGYPVICIEMPIHQQKDQINRAKNHIYWLTKKFQNIKGMSIPLTPVFEKFKDLLPKTADEKSKLTLANTRSRIRMTTLYYIAGIHNYLVVGTGNKVEDFGIGFYTKYGDGGVDISPIADLTKTEVYQIAKSMGISKEILKAPPTDGLWDDDRTDESQIKASYLELEWAMEKLDNYKSKEDKLTEREKKVISIFSNFRQSNKHKMTPIPVCNIPKEYKKYGN